MLPGRIDILVSQNIGNKVDITCFLIKCRAICAAELMGSNFLVRSYFPRLFFNHILDSLYAHALSLSGEEEGVLVSRQGNGCFSGCIHVCF